MSHQLNQDISAFLHRASDLLDSGSSGFDERAICARMLRELAGAIGTRYDIRLIRQKDTSK
jgi:hypothetical protein